MIRREGLTAKRGALIGLAAGAAAGAALAVAVNTVGSLKFGGQFVVGAALEFGGIGAGVGALIGSRGSPDVVYASPNRAASEEPQSEGAAANIHFRFTVR